MDYYFFLKRKLVHLGWLVEAKTWGRGLMEELEFLFTPLGSSNKKIKPHQGLPLRWVRLQQAPGNSMQPGKLPDLPEAERRGGTGGGGGGWGLGWRNH